MMAIDASALIALMDRADAHHRRALGIFAGALEEPVIAHPVNVAEALVGPARLGKGAHASRAIAALGVVLLEHDDGTPGRLAELRATTGLPMPDCCALEAATASGARLATFDAGLAKAAAGLGIEIAA